jgi:hypothetical protein
MNVLIYLDQNTLSDLRDRKLQESDSEHLKLLKDVFNLEKISVVYSHVTLSEILQIKNPEYQKEHIQLLTDLNAKYINPLHRTLNFSSPEVIWHEYLDDNLSNDAVGITNLIEISQLFSRKITGLPIGDSFIEINDKLKTSLHNVLFHCEETLKSIDIQRLEEPLKSYYANMLIKLEQLKINASSLQTPTIPEDQQLGPLPFRDMPTLKVLEIQNIDPDKVVHAIEAIFTLENKDFKFDDYMENTIQNAIARAYSLMNWAGYYADDFTRIKRGKDRFNASNNDMQHSISAVGVNFLISSDVNFLKKVQACYAYVDCQTIACTPKDFIEVYCEFA